MFLLFLYLGLALGFSFLCSLLEAVILSVSPSFIQVQLKNNKKGAAVLEDLKDNMDRPLAAILTVNTISHTIGAAGVGAQVQKIYSDEYLTIASAILTVLILVFSEIIPKTLGHNYWKKIALPCALIIRFLIYITLPFVWLSKFISKIFANDDENDHTMTREEMIVAAETGLEEGVLVEKEQRIIKNLLRLNAILAEDVMTPQSVVFALQKDETVGKVIEKKSPIFFSRIPVYDKSLDDMIGMVLRFKIIEAYSNDEDNRPVQNFIMPIHSVSWDTNIAIILDEFIKRREHLFVVTDDLGGTAGIITLEDVIETLLGVEIVDEFDSVEDMRKFALEQWENRKKSRKYQYVGKPAEVK